MKTSYGWAWIKDCWRPFLDYREISKGKHKGSFEILTRESRSTTRKNIVEPKYIKRFPEALIA